MADQTILIEIDREPVPHQINIQIDGEIFAGEMAEVAACLVLSAAREGGDGLEKVLEWFEDHLYSKRKITGSMGS